MGGCDREHGRLAIEEELKSIDNSGAWTNTNMPPENSIIPSEMVFNRELNDQGQVFR